MFAGVMISADIIPGTGHFVPGRSDQGPLTLELNFRARRWLQPPPTDWRSPASSTNYRSAAATRRSFTDASAATASSSSLVPPCESITSGLTMVTVDLPCSS